MSPVFTINFRREAYRRELARTRGRLIALGVWVAYFGAIGVILGLYGMNCGALTRRVASLERQMERTRSAQHLRQDWTIEPAQLRAVEEFHNNPRRWRDKLARLSALLPSNAVLMSVAVNPDNLSNPADANKLVVVGRFRATGGRDQMRDVVGLVSALHQDSSFATGYRSIRLASSRSAEGPSPMTEFVIECR